MVDSGSPFTDGFNLYTLSFVALASGEVELVQPEDGGNPVLQPVTGSMTVELVVTLRTTSDPKVLNLVGADVTKVPLKGRCVDPMAVPSGVAQGMTCPLDVNGVSGVFTMGPTWPPSVTAVEEALGQSINGTWSANE